MQRVLLAIGIGLLAVLAPIAASAQTFGRAGNATFLDIFPREHMTCGNRGWTFSGLIKGDKPITACILKYRNNVGVSPFGRL